MTKATVTSTMPLTLLNMLQYCRPAGSKSERRFIRQYIEPLGVQRDGYGNLLKRIGDAPVLWSSHTDSVHKRGGMQRIALHNGLAVLNDNSSNCLGADDAVGVYLMREMVLAGVPGLYVFHRSEERGGNGSAFIADTTPTLLSGIKAAVAFDRRGTTDIITHQGSARCCSDNFAWSLSALLPIGYQPDDTGVFTDTANYTGLVGECTNVSVGYAGEHTTKEAVDLGHVDRLRVALLALDWGKLTFERQPGECDPHDWDWDHLYPDAPAYGHNDNRGAALSISLRDLIKNYPDQVADLLQEYGYDYKALADEIWNRGGYRN